MHTSQKKEKREDRGKQFRSLHKLDRRKNGITQKKKTPFFFQL